MYTDRVSDPAGRAQAANNLRSRSEDNLAPRVKSPLCDPEAPVDPEHPCGFRTIPYSDYDFGVIQNGTTYLHWNDFYDVQMH
jgi:hypothetical protein